MEVLDAGEVVRRTPEDAIVRIGDSRFDGEGPMLVLTGEAPAGTGTRLVVRGPVLLRDLRIPDLGGGVRVSLGPAVALDRVTIEGSSWEGLKVEAPVGAEARYIDWRCGVEEEAGWCLDLSGYFGVYNAVGGLCALSKTRRNPEVQPVLDY